MTATTSFFTTYSNRSEFLLHLFPSLVLIAPFQTSSDAWFKPTEENIHSGVCLRVDQGTFRVFPYGNPHLQPFERVVKMLNPAAAVKVRSVAIHAVLAHAFVFISKFCPDPSDITPNLAQKMLNRYLSIKMSAFGSSIQ